MANIQHPLTPPPTYGSLPTSPQDEVFDLSDDSDHAVEQYLELLCPDLNFIDLIQKYNRVYIPVEEDWQLKRNLKKALQEARLSDDPEGAKNVVMRELTDLQTRRIEAENKYDRRGLELLISITPLSGKMAGKWYSLLRGRHLLALTDFVCDIMPHIFEQLATKESAAAAVLATVEASRVLQDNSGPTNVDKQNPLVCASKPKGITKKRRNMKSPSGVPPRKSPRLNKK